MCSIGLALGVRARVNVGVRVRHLYLLLLEVVGAVVEVHLDIYYEKYCDSNALMEEGKER